MAAPFDISQAWNPDIWRQAMREKLATLPSILNAGIATSNPLFNELAAGGGTSVNLPHYLDSSDQDDAIQVENQAPTAQTLATGKQVAPVLNREWASQVTALSGQVSDTDPVGEINAQMAITVNKQRNKTLHALLKGAFRLDGTAGDSAPLEDVRLDLFDESGDNATSDQTFGYAAFSQGKALLGEVQDQLVNGAMLVHPKVLSSLEIQDEDSFKTITPSRLPFTIRTYRDIPIFVSSRLARAGSSNGFVYDTFLFAPGIVAIGEKPQAYGGPGNPVLGVATINLTVDASKNNAEIINRSRFLMHLNGLKWTGTPGGQSATNAELATYSNWDLVFQSADRCGVVCIRTNA